MSVRRLLAAAVLSGVALVATATPALAHAELTASTPAKGASLATPPVEVSLTFDEPVTLGENPISVTGPGGVSWTVGTPTIAGAVITAPVQASGPAGPYTLAYTVISDDGDDVTGSVAFTLTAPADQTTTTATTTTTEAAASTTTTRSDVATTSADDTGGGIPVWVWIVGAVLLVAAGLLIALRVGRPRRS